MGGRGGSSGLSKNVISSVPDESAFKPVRHPELQGSEKQVAWAKDIRRSILRELTAYTIMQTSDGRPSSLYSIAKQGTEAIKKDIENSPLVKGVSAEIKKQNIAREISGYQDLADRIKRYNEIASNTSAKFWIDNRTNQQENYMNKKLKRKIDGK